MDIYGYNLETTLMNSYIVVAGRQIPVEASDRLEAALIAVRRCFEETGRFPYGRVRIVAENGVWYGYENPVRSWEAAWLAGRIAPMEA